MIAVVAAALRRWVALTSSWVAPGMPGGAVVLVALLPVTVLQITLIHIDHAVPPRCINLLDIGCGLRR
jgi:hypothetical protein